MFLLISMVAAIIWFTISVVFSYSFDQMIKICPMHLLLGQLENDPFVAFVVYASNTTVINLVPQDSNL